MKYIQLLNIYSY